MGTCHVTYGVLYIKIVLYIITLFRTTISLHINVTYMEDDPEVNLVKENQPHILSKFIPRPPFIIPPAEAPSQGFPQDKIIPGRSIIIAGHILIMG